LGQYTVRIPANLQNFLILSGRISAGRFVESIAWTGIVPCYIASFVKRRERAQKNLLNQSIREDYDLANTAQEKDPEVAVENRPPVKKNIDLNQI
jgi:hypothetical protein